MGGKHHQQQWMVNYVMSSDMDNHHYRLFLLGKEGKLTENALKTVKSTAKCT